MQELDESLQDEDILPSVAAILSTRPTLNKKLLHVKTESTVTTVQEQFICLPRGPAPSTHLERKRFNILCLDGGGMRGLIHLEMLRAIEQRTNKKIHELFDMVCGTSTGAIVASMIVCEFNLDTIEKIYYECADQVFSKYTTLDMLKVLQNDDKGMYPTNEYENLIKKYMGEEPLMHSDFPDPKLKLFMITAEQTSGRYEPVLFRNYKTPYKDRGSEFPKVLMYEAIRATSAAPFYFDACYINNSKFVDGGVVANNPAHQAIMEARIMFGMDKEFNLISFGTGVGAADNAKLQARIDEMLKEEQHYSADQPQVKKKKKSGWSTISRLIGVATDSDRIAKDTEKYLYSSCKPNQVDYFRFSPPGLGDMDLATVDREQLQLFHTETRKYVIAHLDEFSVLCSRVLEALETSEVCDTHTAESTDEMTVYCESSVTTTTTESFVLYTENSNSQEWNSCSK